MSRPVLINPGYVATMARYNAAMNQRLYDAAGRLTDAGRRQDRGAFWGSIHGTLCHLVWGDRTWMSRLDGWDKPEVPIKASASFIPDFERLGAERERIDTGLTRFAEGVTDAWIAGEMTWFSGAAGREITAPRDVVLMHLFNHQTHHRGQAHALITAAGEATGDTDLFMLARP